MESHGHKSLRAQRYRAQLGPHPMPMTPDRGEPESGPSAMNGNGCGKHVITPVFGPPPPFQGILAQDEGVVQSDRQT